jgi:palmitoyltransferase ZDHHC13/17
MWAAYKGFPQCVDLLLKWGANVYSRDNNGFTALHWALVKGQQHGIFKLVEYGSDRFAETNDGKTPAVVAKEMNSLRPYHAALAECNYNLDGSPRSFPLSSVVKDRKAFYWRLYFFYPFAALFIVLYITSHLVIYLALPLAFLVAFGIQKGAQKALRWAPTDMKTMHKTVRVIRGTDVRPGANELLAFPFRRIRGNLILGGCTMADDDIAE